MTAFYMGTVSEFGGAIAVFVVFLEFEREVCNVPQRRVVLLARVRQKSGYSGLSGQGQLNSAVKFQHKVTGFNCILGKASLSKEITYKIA